MLPVLVGGMRLAGKDQLDGPPLIEKDFPNAIHVLEDQRSAFVSGEAARKSDRQSFRIEERSHRDNLPRVDVIQRPAAARPLARKCQKLTLELLVHIPEFLVRNVLYAIPEGDFVVVVHPIGSKMPIEHLSYLRRDPSRRMHAVGDMCNRNVVFSNLRINILPHAAGDAAMQFTDAVAKPGKV